MNGNRDILSWPCPRLVLFHQRAATDQPNPASARPSLSAGLLRPCIALLLPIISPTGSITLLCDCHLPGVCHPSLFPLPNNTPHLESPSIHSHPIHIPHAHPLLSLPYPGRSTRSLSICTPVRHFDQGTSLVFIPNQVVQRATQSPDHPITVGF